MFKALARLLFDWVFVLLFKALTALLKLVDFVEDIFDVFAGTAKVTYNGQKDYLINVFFGQSSISVVFWGITAISMTLCFAFTIVAVTRKTLDIGDSVKNSVGQIVTNAGKAGLTFLILNFVCIASINLANVVLVQVDYLMKNANVIMEDDQDNKTFSGEEYAAMTRIMNTISNYSLVPSPHNRFNINACYNAVRGDLYYLYYNGMFDAYYGEGHDNWQAALALIAGAADIENDLPLGEVNSSVSNAITTVMDELKYNRDFKPLQSAPRLPVQTMRMDNTIFLTSTLEAPYSSVYRRNPSFTDALRRSYSDGTKHYTNLKQVRKDFDIWEVRYDIGYVTCIVFIVIMVKCIFTFIIRLFDLLLLYISAPFFVSTMPLDDGQKFQAWRSAFIVKLISGFGSVMAMRLYLMLVPVVMDGKLVFFEDAGTNYLAQILFILAGAFAVMKATSLLSNIVAGTPGAAARGEELGSFLGGAVLGKGMSMAVGGLSSVGHLGKSAVGGAAHKISSHRAARGEKGGESDDVDEDEEEYLDQMAEMWAPSPRASLLGMGGNMGAYGGMPGNAGAAGGMSGNNPPPIPAKGASASGGASAPKGASDSQEASVPRKEPLLGTLHGIEINSIDDLAIIEDWSESAAPSKAPTPPTQSEPSKPSEPPKPHSDPS